MKKRIVAVLLSAAMIFTMAPVSPVSAAPEESDNSQPAVQVDAENPGNNIALKATADASYTNTYGISTEMCIRDRRSTALTPRIFA